MPYISPKLREFYDMIIRGIHLKLSMDGLDLEDEKKYLSNHMKNLEMQSQDGEFNYFITKLLISLSWVETYSGYFDLAGGPQAPILEDFILYIVKEVYPPKYFNYNRAIGMLSCCLKEFKRRYGKEATCVEILLNKIIDKLYAETIGPYEDKKRLENGEVTK